MQTMNAPIKLLVRHPMDRSGGTILQITVCQPTSIWPSVGLQLPLGAVPLTRPRSSARRARATPDLGLARCRRWHHAGGTERRVPPLQSLKWNRGGGGTAALVQEQLVLP
jgi:hypothetical protein